MKKSETLTRIDSTPRDFADAIIGKADREELREFILAIDEHIAEYDFTFELAKELILVLREEHGIENKPLNHIFHYCPLTWLKCPGPYKVLSYKEGGKRKDCSTCKLNYIDTEGSRVLIQHWIENTTAWKGEIQTEQRIIAALHVDHSCKSDLQKEGQTMKETATTLCVDVNLSDLAFTLARDTNISRKDLKEFILSINEFIAEYDFTFELAKSLILALKNEHVNQVKPFNIRDLED